MLIGSLVFLLPEFLIVVLINKKTSNRLNPASVMFYIWSILLILAASLGNSWGYYPMKISGILTISLFLFVILIVFYVACKKDVCVCYELPKESSYTLCLLFVSLYFFSEAMYFIKLNAYIPINELPFQLWKWKNLILAGTFDENSILFIGKWLSFIGTIIAYTFINESKKSRRIILGFIVIVYILMAFFYPRRDVMINKLVCILTPFTFKYRKSLKNLLKIVLPIGIFFVIIFFYINDSLTFGESNIKHAIASYSFGSFNSLQKALDIGYPTNTNLLLGNTFYFLYMILKYVFPSLAPPSIILETLGQDTSNVYTSLIAPVLDANGDVFYMIVAVLLYAIWIGMIMCISYNFYLKKQTIASLCLYSTVFSCVVRSFYNPTFSYSDIVFAVLYSIILSMLTKIFGKENRF